MATRGVAGTPGAPGSRDGTDVDPDQVTFVLADAQHRLLHVRLAADVPLPGPQTDLEWHQGEWRVTVPRPPVARMEYRFEVTRPGGEREWLLDPANPLRAPGSFGERSELRFAGYRPPGWLTQEAQPGTSTALEIPGDRRGEPVRVRVWSAAGLPPSGRAALVLAHDGPEYDALARLTHYVAVSVRDRTVPPLRVALIDPGPRDRWYAANRTYADRVALEVVPALRARFPTGRVIGLGASLGALAWLHVQRTHPHVLDGMFLQSGSFFRPDLDAQERRFSGFPAIVRFVTALEREPSPRPVPTVLTCGAAEENAANNRRMARVLASQRYPTQLVEGPDLHNYTAFRDALDPSLADLVSRV